MQVILATWQTLTEESRLESLDTSLMRLRENDEEPPLQIESRCPRSRVRVSESPIADFLLSTPDSLETGDDNSDFVPNSPVQPLDKTFLWYTRIR